MADDKNTIHTIAEEFVDWLTQTQSARAVNKYFTAIFDADTYLLEHNLSKHSLFLLNSKDVASLISALRGNRSFRYKTNVSMQDLQKATILFGKFLDERDKRAVNKFVNLLTKPALDLEKQEQVPVNISKPVIEPKPVKMATSQKAAFVFEGTDLLTAVINNKIRYVNNLDADGALWIIGGSELEGFVTLAKEKGFIFKYKPDGSRNSSWMPCWWYKPAKRPESPLKQNSLCFEGLLDDAKYTSLRDTLLKEGIFDLGALRKINLWSFMNRHSLYSIQTRLAISTELHDKLQVKNTLLEVSQSYIVRIFDKEFIGATPSDAFAALMTYVATKYPLKFRSICGTIHPQTMKAVLRRNNNDRNKIKLMNPEVYIDRDLTKEQIEEYIRWVLTKCTGSVPTFSVVCVEPEPVKTEVQTVAPSQSQEVEQHQPEKAVHVPKTFPNPTPYIVKKAEDFLLSADLEGLSFDELQQKLNTTAVGMKEAVAQSPNIIEMDRRFYHQEAFVDFEEGADAIADILDKLIKKNNGVVSTKQLVEYVRSEMQMFLNDNNLTGWQQIVDLAWHLFDKIEYKGIHYVFKSNMYISAPDAVVETFIDVVRNFALESSSTVTYDAIKEYVSKAGLSADNIRGKIKINVASDFLVYDENEYLLSESIHIDDVFLGKMKSALEHLFADVGDHIIMRNIAPSWYGLLPELPYGLSWTTMLLQQILRYWGKKLGARTIQAMNSQDSNAVHAMLVSEDSIVQDFRDAVAIYLSEEIPERDHYDAEELRGILVNASMLQGNELIWNMHKALSKDPRFIWSSDNQSVRVIL